MLKRLCAEAVRQGTLTPIVCVSTKMGIGVDELLAVLTQAALPPTAVAANGDEGWRRGHAQVRSGRTAGGAGVQDANRPVRAAAELHPRVLRHAEEGQHGAFVGGTERRQDRAAAFGAGRKNDSRSRWRSPATSWRLPRPRICTRARRSARSSCRRSNSRRRWSAWPWRRKLAATRRSFPALSTRLPKKIERCVSTTTRKPRRWSSPA